MRAAVDVMGGDKAPAAILKGCWEAAPLLDPEDTVLLVGDKDVIAHGLAESGLTNEQIGDAAQLMRNASGMYDTAARAAASL